MPVNIFSDSMKAVQKIMIEVKDVHGIYRTIPLSSYPSFSTEYSMASTSPMTEISHVDFEINRLVVTDATGNIVSEYMGPFHSSNTFKHQVAPNPVAKKVLIEFEGQHHWLSVGDVFNLTYNLEVPQELLVTVDSITLINNFLLQKKVTIKDIAGDTTKAAPYISSFDFDGTFTSATNYHTQNQILAIGNPDQQVKFEPEKWTELVEASLKQDWTTVAWGDETSSFQETKKKKGPHIEFNHVWIEKQKCYVISGFDGNNRYEIILGKPIDKFPKFYEEVLRMDIDVAPLKLHQLIVHLNRSLKAKLGEGQQEFLKHPGLMQQVPCPHGMDLDDPCAYHHPSNIGNGTDDLQTMIIHLNDNHRWTREAIAEWIDTLDEQPVFYPKSQPERVANSAKVVALKPPVSEAPKH